jgi:hypothetical protein
MCKTRTKIWAVTVSVLLIWMALLAVPLKSVEGVDSCPDDPDRQPKSVKTPAGIHVVFHYDLAQEKYTVRWRKGAALFGPSPQLPLTVVCEPARFEWENSKFVVLRQGCGSPCWFEIVLPLQNGRKIQQVMYTVAHDEKRSLIASIESEPLMIINLITGRQQSIVLKPECAAAFPGWCLDDVAFKDGALHILWRSWVKQEARVEKFVFALDPAVLAEK